MAKTEREVILERPREGVALVRINRPEALNALNLAVREQLGAVFGEIQGDESIRAVVLTGTDKAFAAGADLKEFVDIGAVEQMRRRVERYWRAVADTPQPIIAAISGFALGGGLELAMCADILIAGESAKLGQPEVRVGIIPGAGGTQRLTRAVGKYQSMYMCLSGEFVSAEEALRMGLLSKVVTDGEVEQAALELAGNIAKLPPLAVQQAKEMIIAGADAPLETALVMERRAMQVLFASEDKREGMSAFIEKRKPSFKGR
jgi:enoyl-CoA hydratase/carnithine racemase